MGIRGGRGGSGVDRWVGKGGGWEAGGGGEGGVDVADSPEQ